MIPRVMSIWSAAVILGPIVGPTLGGWLTENFSWRWVFYINVPIGILAFLGIWTFMDRDDGGRQRPFDFLGFGALVAVHRRLPADARPRARPGLVRLQGDLDRGGDRRGGPVGLHRPDR